MKLSVCFPFRALRQWFGNQQSAFDSSLQRSQPMQIGAEVSCDLLITLDRSILTTPHQNCRQRDVPNAVVGTERSGLIKKDDRSVAIVRNGRETFICGINHSVQSFVAQSNGAFDQRQEAIASANLGSDGQGLEDASTRGSFDNDWSGA